MHNLNAQMQNSWRVGMTSETPVIKIFLFPTVKVTERPTREQRTPHPAPEEEGVRTGGGEEEKISVGCGTRWCTSRDQEAAEKTGASSRRAQGHQDVQHWAQGPAVPHQWAQGRGEKGSGPHSIKKHFHLIIFYCVGGWKGNALYLCTNYVKQIGFRNNSVYF